MAQHHEGEPRRLAVSGADLEVSARLDGPVGEGPLLVLGHGAGAGMDHPHLVALVEALADVGVASLRYQFPFMQRLVDRGATRTFGRDPEPVARATVRAAVALARQSVGKWPLLAGGQSYGGRMTSLAAAADELGRLDGLVLLSFPLHTAGRPNGRRGAHLAGVDRSILLLSGERDRMATAPLLEQAAARCARARVVRIPDADHGWKTARRTWPAGPWQRLATEIRAFAGELTKA